MANKRTLPHRRPAKRKALKLKQTVGGYQFKITLQGSSPPIWRRFQVRDCTLAELHNIIQVVMGWEDGHLHQFVIDGTYYQPEATADDPFGAGKMHMEEEYRLSEIIPIMAEKFQFRYEYDFGDSWDHMIQLEKRLPEAKTAAQPLCLEGKRACPPEDCGGIWGYEEILAGFKDKDNPDFAERLEWLGDDFDPDAFSVEKINQRFKKHF